MLRLPTFELNGAEYFRRVTMIVRDGTILKVFYPVSPEGVHYRLPRALSDRRAPRARVPDLKAVPARDGLRGREPGAVLPA